MSSKKPQATLYRMVMHKHTCPYGLKAKHLLKRKGFGITEKLLNSREQVDTFKAQHNIKTTPQVFINGERIGGYDALKAYLEGGELEEASKKTSYKPVIVLFGLSFLTAIAVSLNAFNQALNSQTLQWFIAFSMINLALLKLQDIERFSTVFLNYDLLAKRWVPYAYIYPFAEAVAGILMAAGIFHIISAPLALVIGTIGAASVFKAVYLEKRTLKCACVGGNNNVPLGFISLLENILMVAMALWMAWAFIL